MNLKSLLVIILLTFVLVEEHSCRPITILQDILRNNVAGPAVNLQTISWPIDPDGGLKRRSDYEAINGRYGFRHVERIGLGMDGKAEERREQQRLRDEAGALSYRPPS